MAGGLVAGVLEAEAGEIDVETHEINFDIVFISMKVLGFKLWSSLGILTMPYSQRWHKVLPLGRLD